MKREPKTQVNFRVEKSLWQTFVEMCQQEDTSAGRELRRFVRAVIANRKQMTLDEIAKKEAKK